MKNSHLIFRLTGVICLGGLLLINACQPQAEEKPNIIWIMAEDIGNDLECYGTPGLQTPNLNALAREGEMYTNCFCTSPICSPNRSAMMTGVHQNIINAEHHRSNRSVQLPSPYRPITYYLRKAGYTCILGNKILPGNGGKVDVNFKTKGTGPWNDSTAFGLFDKFGEISPADQPFFNQVQLKVTHRGDWWDEVRDRSEDPVSPDEVVLPPFLADDPVIRADWAEYLDQIEAADQQVGILRQQLEELGMAGNTIIIFIGDNGRCNIKGKNHLYDSGLRVPLIVYRPGQNPAEEHKVNGRLVSVIDISASILQIAGAEIPGYMTAIPFIGDPDAPEREFVYSARDYADEILERSRAITTLKYRYIRNYITDQSSDAGQAYLEFYRPALHVMRRLKEENRLNPGQEQYFSPVKPEEELYDLTTDPFEMDNLAAKPEYADQLQKMRDYMDRWQAENRDMGLLPPDTAHIVHPESVDVLAWVKKEKPELYRQMLEGEEIGFQSLAREYKETLAHR